MEETYEYPYFFRGPFLIFLILILLILGSGFYYGCEK